MPWGGAEQLQNNIYAVLYDLALTLGGHLQVQPLLDAVLQRMLYHTGLPAGFIYLQDEQHPARARLASVVGDFDLKGAAGRSFDAPAGAGDRRHDDREIGEIERPAHQEPAPGEAPPADGRQDDGEKRGDGEGGRAETGEHCQVDVFHLVPLSMTIRMVGVA
jgi:hypothetical protein